MVVIAESENVKIILWTSLHDFELGPKRSAGFAGLFGEGILDAEGARWSWCFARICETAPQDTFATS